MNIAASHLVNKGNKHAGTAGADGMSDRDCTAVNIDFIRIETEFAHNA